jgi:hypothetical protein
MNNKFFLIACALAVIALFVHSISRGFMEQAMHRKAARIQEASAHQTAYTPDPAVRELDKKADILTYLGVGMTVLSVASMIAAMIRHERGLYLILLLLLMADIITPMLL